MQPQLSLEGPRGAHPRSGAPESPDLAHARRRRVALDALAAMEAPGETRRVRELPRLADDLRWRVRAAARQLRLRLEYCHVSTAELEKFTRTLSRGPTQESG